MDNVVMLQDLVGIILLSAVLLLVVLLEMSRRGMLALQQLAFALSAMYGVVAIGGLVDHEVSNEQLEAMVYRFRPSFLSVLWTWPMGVSMLLTVLLVHQVWECCGDKCCCQRDSRAKQDHGGCKGWRVRRVIPVYAFSFVFVFTCIGARLNARLRKSAVQPIGGTLHWEIIKCSTLLALTHGASIALVLLRIFIDHVPLSEQWRMPMNYSRSFKHSRNSEQKELVLEKQNKVVEEVVHSLPLPSKTLRRRRSFTRKGEELRVPKAPPSGDVSELISDDSDSDHDRNRFSEFENRFAAQMPIPHDVAAEDAWIECFDQASKSIYYHCEATGESRWDDPSIGHEHEKWN